MSDLHISFGASGNYREFNPVGFDVDSDLNSTWAATPVAELSFEIPLVGKKLLCEVQVSPPSAASVVSQQDCWVFVNGRFLFFKSIRERSTFAFTVPLYMLRNRANLVSFVMPNAETPGDSRIGDDITTYRLCFVRMHISWLECVSEDPERYTGCNASPRALVLDDSVPEPDKDAGSNAMFQHILSLQRLGYAVTFIPSDNMSKIDPYTTELERRGIECLHYPKYFSVEEVLRKRRVAADLVYLHRYSNAAKYGGMIRMHLPQARILYNVADLHFVRIQRQADMFNDPILRKRAELVRRLELGAMFFVDCVIVHSSAEADILRKLAPDLSVRVIPWTVTVGATRQPPVARPSLAFIGNYRHEPNVDAAAWAVHSLMPLLREQLPQVELLLVGSHMPVEVAELAATDVVSLGHVPSLDTVFNRVRLTIAPLRFGSGLKGKVLESLAAGIPCVMTSVAAEGLGLTSKLQSLVADDAKGLAARIVRLCHDQAEHQRIAELGKAYVRETYGAERIDALLRDACDLV
jgi:glycosyltransferase involved in cell wall biosynthesis